MSWTLFAARTAGRAATRTGAGIADELFGSIIGTFLLVGLIVLAVPQLLTQGFAWLLGIPFAYSIWTWLIGFALIVGASLGALALHRREQRPSRTETP